MPLARDPSVTMGEPYLSVGVSDVRGIRNAPRVDWPGQPLVLEPGSELGVRVRARASVTADPRCAQLRAFRLDH
ncbi:MAG: hypothetical protein EXR77_18240 [Myxococcales bacterium]|nr:hypothetical protein [Myxococcales bacterium]